MRALLLDCDGVLAETERDGHLVAFNRAFAEAGLPVRWSVAEYRERLKIGGGKERLAADDRIPPEVVAALHVRKTAIFATLAPQLSPRPGVGRLVDEALVAGWKVAIVSTSAEESVHAVARRVLGDTVLASVLVIAGDAVSAKKPDPAAYELALRRLDCDASDAIAIEDSRQGLVAAAAAGLASIVTPSTFTRDEDFHEAALVVRDLSGITLDDVAHCLAKTSG